jgi:hypothetical protein
MAYFIFSKRLGTFISPTGEKVEIIWLTAREQGMTIPGGVQIQAMIHWRKNEKGLKPFNVPFVGEYYDWHINHHLQFLQDTGTKEPNLKGFLDNFCFCLKLAEERKEKSDDETGASFDTLEFLKPRVVGKDGPPTGEGPFFVYSFRDYEVAQVLFKKGFRVEENGWSELLKVQQKELAATT